MGTSYYQLSSGTVIETQHPECWNSDPNAKRISAKKGKQLQRDEARERLRVLFPPGSEVHCSVTQVARSGMSRQIAVYAIEDGQIRNVSRWVAWATESRLSKSDDAVIIGGCGMDMCFALVYNLSHALYRDGFTCTGETCPSNDHSNPPRPARDGKMHHSESGYALRHRTI